MQAPNFASNFICARTAAIVGGCGCTVYGMFVCLLDYCLFCRYANGVEVYV